MVKPDRAGHIAALSYGISATATQQSLVISRRNGDFLAFVVSGVFRAALRDTSGHDIQSVRLVGPGTDYSLEIRPDTLVEILSYLRSHVCAVERLDIGII